MHILNQMTFESLFFFFLYNLRYRVFVVSSTPLLDVKDWYFSSIRGGQNLFIIWEEITTKENGFLATLLSFEDGLSSVSYIPIANKTWVANGHNIGIIPANLCIIQITLISADHATDLFASTDIP